MKGVNRYGGGGGGGGGGSASWLTRRAPPCPLGYPSVGGVR